MGEVSILTDKQKTILKEVVKDPFITSTFYFTGGTALSEVYLKHRESIDLDFFSYKDFDIKKLSKLIHSWVKKYNLTVQSRFVDPVHVYILEFPDKYKLKIDFTYYRYPQLKKTTKYLKTLSVDSKFDIAVNKLLLLTQRYEIKDFVDLCFLLQEFTFWDLRQGVMAKFNVHIEPLLMAADFLAVEDFDYMPRMIKPLTLKKIKEFFRNKAKMLAKKQVDFR